MTGQIVHTSEAEVIFANKGVNRYFILGFMATGTLLIVLISILGPILDPRSNVNNPQMQMASLVVCTIGMLTGLWFAGPRDLRCNPHTRTYTFIFGWPLLARTVHGSFDDIRRFVIQPYVYRGQESTTYELNVEWTDASRKPATLQYLNMMACYQVRDDIQKKLGLPLEWATTKSPV